MRNSTKGYSITVAMDSSSCCYWKDGSW